MAYFCLSTNFFKRFALSLERLILTPISVRYLERLGYFLSNEKTDFSTGDISLRQNTFDDLLFELGKALEIYPASRIIRHKSLS